MSDRWIPVRESLPPKRADKYLVVACGARSYEAEEGRAIPTPPLFDNIVRDWPQSFTHWKEAQ